MNKKLNSLKATIIVIKIVFKSRRFRTNSCSLIERKIAACYSKIPFIRICRETGTRIHIIIRLISPSVR